MCSSAQMSNSHWNTESTWPIQTEKSSPACTSLKNKQTNKQAEAIFHCSFVSDNDRYIFQGIYTYQMYCCLIQVISSPFHAFKSQVHKLNLRQAVCGNCSSEISGDLLQRQTTKVYFISLNCFSIPTSASCEIF